MVESWPKFRMVPEEETDVSMYALPYQNVPQLRNKLNSMYICDWIFYTYSDVKNLAVYKSATSIILFIFHNETENSPSQAAFSVVHLIQHNLLFWVDWPRLPGEILVWMILL